MGMATAHRYYKQKIPSQWHTKKYINNHIPNKTSPLVLYEASWMETVDEAVLNKWADHGSEFQTEEVKIRVNAARAVEEFNSKQ